jgi:hypothetical protein
VPTFDGLDKSDLEEFERSLSDAIIWCKPRLNRSRLATCFRSPELHPFFDLRIPAIVDCGQCWTDPTTNRRVVEQLINTRRKLIGSTDRFQQTADLYEGRLLMFSGYDSLSEGACSQATDGYFDYQENSPWDTWVWYQIDSTSSTNGKNIIVSWVAPELIEVVERGLKVQSLDWMAWLEDYK